MFYSISGNNGFGVYSDADKLMKNKEFLYDVELTNHTNFNEAWKMCVEDYNNRQRNSADQFTEGMFPRKTNWIIFRNQIRDKMQ